MKSGRMTKNTKLIKTLNGIARYDKGLIGNEVDITEEGYVKGRCIVTRCGVFLYKNADGTIRKELRHPEDVSDIESLESMKMIPIVDGHPSERLVNADNSKRLSVGYTGELVEDEYPYIIANMVVTDRTAVSKIKDKKRNQLSLGYTVDLIPEEGNYNGEPYDYRQTNIRYNHLALVDEARAGPEARIVLDGEDAESIEINQMGATMAKKQRKVKFDNSAEYMVDDEVGEGMDKLMAEKEALLKTIESMKNDLDKAHAERDSLRDKDMHDPKAEHEPLEEKTEEDEIGTNGKEMIDPVDSYGMSSHVRDYEKPMQMKEHVVTEPKNQHYPHDLPHVSKVDHADIRAQVKERVKLEKLGSRYLDGQALTRMDSMSDMEIKKRLILSIQKNAVLEGKSDAYINARFDSVLEDLPRERVIANPARLDADVEKDRADANSARQNMIRRHRDAYKNKVRA